MKKSRIAALVAGTALAAFTFGCGGGNDNATNATNTPAANITKPANTATGGGASGGANAGGGVSANTSGGVVSANVSGGASGNMSGSMNRANTNR